MERTNRKWTRGDVVFATGMANHHAEEYLQKVDHFKLDYRKEQRAKEHECKFCFYLHRPRIGGASITTANCSICDKKMMFGSTTVDRLCPECSDKHSLCVFCGGDLDMRDKRRKFEF